MALGRLAIGEGVGTGLTARADPGRDPGRDGPAPRADPALGGLGVMATRALPGASELPYALRMAPLLPNSPLARAERLLLMGVEV